MARTTSYASRTRTAAPDPVCLVDLRPVQYGRVHESAVDEILRSPGRIVGLIDPREPPPTVAGVTKTVPNAYAALDHSVVQFVQVAADDDPLTTARLRADPAITIRTIPANASAPDRLAEAVARYWRSPRPAAASARVAVLTSEPALPICHVLRMAGAEIMRPTPMPSLSPGWRALWLIGNTPDDRAALDMLRRFGGDVLLLDPCLLAADTDTGALDLATSELGRTIGSEEFSAWRDGLVSSTASLLGELATTARRILVSGQGLADHLRDRHGRDALVVLLPTPPRLQAHAAGLWAECCVLALEQLSDWGVPCVLDLVGPAAERPGLLSLAKTLGVADRVGAAAGPPSVVLALSASGTAAASLRVAEAMSAGLPTIVTRPMQAARASGASALPEQPSPVLLAEAILAALPDPAAPLAAAQRIVAALRG